MTGRMLVPWPLSAGTVACGLLALVLLALVRGRPRWPAWRLACGLSGLLVLAVALGAPLEDGADALLSVHMVQHLLVQLVAAPLLVLAAPGRLLLGALPPRAGRRLARGLRAPAVRRLASLGAALALFVGVLAVVHVPAVYDAALARPWLHAVEHAALFWSAVALWLPVVGAAPLPRRAGPVARLSVLTLAMGAMTLLAAWLAASTTAVYPHYAAAGAALGRDVLADQTAAAGIMGLGGMAIVGPVVVAAAWSALVAEERVARAREAAADRGVAARRPTGGASAPATADGPGGGPR